MNSSTKQHLYLMTGASRGMGLAMAEQLLQAGHALLTLARQPNDSLQAVAAQHGAQLTQWAVDLSDAAAAATRLRSWLVDKAADPFASVTLINNAGMIPAIVPLRDAVDGDTAQALRVGLEAPMLLTAAFLDATRAWQVKRRVLNISSGLGRRPMASQAAYCAAKAGMDLFTHCVALDEASQANGALLCSLAPGVIDTDMQVHLRSAEPESFPDRDNFTQLKSSGNLSSPEEAARRVLAYLERPDFGNQVVADVRD